MDRQSSADREDWRPVFHVSPHPLPAGCVLRPYAIAVSSRAQLHSAVHARASGMETVVRLVRSDQWRGAGSNERYAVQMVVLEAAFEWVRLRVAPSLPSRLATVFAWDTIVQARSFRDTYLAEGVIHSCSMLAGRRIRRDGALVVEAYGAADLAYPSLEDLLRLEELAARYWREGDPLQLPEVLVQGTVVVDAIVKTERA